MSGNRSSLGSIFTNFFMSFHEKLWLENCPSDYKPIFYTRYADDCFVLFWNKTHEEKFHICLNLRHKTIKFENKKTFLFGYFG